LSQDDDPGHLWSRASNVATKSSAVAQPLTPRWFSKRGWSRHSITCQVRASTLRQGHESIHGPVPAERHALLLPWCGWHRDRREQHPL